MDGSAGQSSTRGVRRSGMFAYSDVRAAAEDFVFDISIHADPVWEHEDRDKLAGALTEKALQVLHDPEATF